MEHAATTAVNNQAAFEILRACGQTSIYLMGMSFIVGSLFTILVLIFLDFIRRNKQDTGKA